MDSLSYYGYAKLMFLAQEYVREHFQAGDSFCVIDTDGTPLLGLAVEEKPAHLLQVVDWRI